jgi:hypothetical protein
MANTYGLGDDKVDRYKAVYNTFGNLMVKMYPSLMPTFMPYEKAVDKSFLNSVISNHPELMQAKPCKQTMLKILLQQFLQKLQHRV